MKIKQQNQGDINFTAYFKFLFFGFISLCFFSCTDNKNEKIRLFGVDAPEHNQEWGKESREALSKLILGKEILLNIKDRDQFGRAVAVLFVENINVNLEMIKTGNAWYYEFFDKNNSENKKAMENAKKKKLGLWSKPNPIRPYEFKKDK